ncbi:MAG: endonuclease [Bacteroidetes bacterium]|nr:endonuclease [Bacteroidota bacterium]
MKKIFFLCLLFLPLTAFLQENKPLQDFDEEVRGRNGLRIMFYNLENFYDTHNDSIANDDDFTAFGMKHWGREKYNCKLNHIYKVIASIGGWEPPEIIGVCEVENKWVVSELAAGTPLRKFNYRYIHYDSPDPRGIDVAMLYRPDKFKPVFHQPLRIIFPFDTAARTRDVLYVKGLTASKDTLHLFVNHFPSKFGGAMITISKRNYVARFLWTKVDSILAVNPDANIVIMGDFNDEPTDESILQYLKSKCDTNELTGADLYNLMCKLKAEEKIGTNKFREQWSLIDQMIVSTALVKNSKSWHVKNMRAFIYKADFLLQPDETYMGVKTFRTYTGPRYTGGFSDHLPVYMDLEKGEN